MDVSPIRIVVESICQRTGAISIIGLEKLAEYVALNQQRGIMYGYNKDYDNLDSEETVLNLLRTGKMGR